MDIISVLITFVSLFSLTGALQCYTCDNCFAATGETETCNFIDEAAGAMCGKFISESGDVSRECTNQVECTANGLVLDECVAGNEIDCYTCCSTDLCNAGTSSITATTTSCFILVAATMLLRLLK